MVNHNVRITFAVRIADGIATGIWASSVLSTYINILEGDNDRANERVGYAQAIQGTFLAAAAIPAGWLAITYRRDAILKVMGLVAFAAIATTSAALVLDVPYKYGLLCCGLALWGVAQANAPVLDALFADSVPTGNRSKLYTWLHMSYIVSQGIGPGVGAAMFALNGNVWRLEVLQRVMLVGMALAAVPALLMLCFDDDQALGAESEGLLRVALLRPPDEEEGEEEGVSGSGRRRDVDSYGSQSPGGGEADYRQPFLDGWNSDTEREYRAQVSAAASPARPVFPALAAAAVTSAGGGGVASGYFPPDLVPGPPGGGAVDFPGGAAAGLTTAPAAAARLAAGGAAGGAAAVGGAAQEVSSHALLLSPTNTNVTMSPTTDRSGVVTPTADTSPPPGAAAAAAAGAPSASGHPPGGGAAAVAAAAAAKLWLAGASGLVTSGQDAGGSRQGAVRDAAGGQAAARPGERFLAVRQAVDGAAAGADGGDATDVSPPSSAGQSYDRRRSISIGGGAVAAAAVAQTSGSGSVSGSGGGADDGGGVDAAAAAAVTAAGDTSGYDSAVSSSREQSLMTDSLPSELSFNSLLGPASFKSRAQSRPFSRTGSSSSGGSARAGGGGGSGNGGGAAACGSAGAGAGAAAAGPGLLPHPEEDPSSEGPGGDNEPETPTLEPQAQGPASSRHLPQPPPPLLRHPPMQPASSLTAATAAAAAAGNGNGSGPAGLSSGVPPGYGTGRPVAVPDRAQGRHGTAAAAANGRAVNGGGGGHGVGGTAGGVVREGRVVRWSPTVMAAAARQPPPQLSARSSLDPRRHRFLCLTMAWIPGVLALTDCIMGLASGMTIKFFPIFFKDEVRLAPMYVNLMYCAIPLCLSASSYIAQRESRLMGRVATMVLNRGIGITLLYWIATHTHRWHDQRLMVPVYIARTSIMNSIYPLQKSILMDFVPKERRAAWNSLEAVTSFGWSGSAALGGWLIHKFGFRTTFLVTATMQCIGWAVSLLLLPIVPRREVGLQVAIRKTAPTAPRGASGPGGPGPSAPPGRVRGSAAPGRGG